MRASAYTILFLSLLLVGVAPAQDSLNVRLVGACYIPDLARDIALSGDHAYVADLDNGMRVISIVDPAHPVVVGTSGPNEADWGVAVNGEYAYLSDANRGLRVLSVADPTHPAEVGLYEAALGVWDVAVCDGYAYVAERESGMCIISIVDPTHPTRVGHWSNGNAVGVAVSGSYAYIAVDSWGIRVVSIADPGDPLEVGSYYTPSLHTSGLVTRGQYVYIAAGSAGLRVISVADPTNPVEVGCWDGWGEDVAVAVYGDTAYVGNYQRGLRVVSVADPMHPVEVGHYGMPDSTWGVAADGDYVYVAADGCCCVFQVYGAAVEETPTVEARMPNPIPTIARGVLLLPEASSHNSQAASLLDAAGRKVAELHPGANDVRSLSPGVYFVREARAQAQAQAVRKVIVQ